MMALLGKSTHGSNYTNRYPIHIPESLLHFYNEDVNCAIVALRENPLYDEVQAYLRESSSKHDTSSWNPMAQQVSSGTLDIRCNGAGTRVAILGEGYSTKLFTGGIQGWKTVAKDVTKDTDYFHDSTESRFEIVRVHPGAIGLILKPSEQSSPYMQLLPGRYVLLKKFARLVGVATLSVNTNCPFKHPQSLHNATEHLVDPDIVTLGNRFTAYQLQAGRGLFVDDRHGTFYLATPTASENSVFFFDHSSLETPNKNTVNPRDTHIKSDKDTYHILRLTSGQRILLRGPDGEDIVLEHSEKYPERNLLHLPSIYFTFNGRIYNRTHQIAHAETLTSVSLASNDVLVLRDDDGNLRFLEDFDAKRSITIRQPWIVEDVIGKMRNIYTFSDGVLQVAYVKPTNNQWPIIFDQRSGEVKMLPPSLKYVFNSADGQTYIGMADQNEKNTQTFYVEGVGAMTIAVVESGQIGMVRINHFSFFLPPSPKPYIVRPPNEFLGLVDKDMVMVKIPNSDLHRLYIPSGQWAVAMIDGRQVVLDPATNQHTAGRDEGAFYNGDNGSKWSTKEKAKPSKDSSASGIWIFRAQQLDLQGPKPVDEKYNQLYNVQRIQVPMDEVGYGYDQGTLTIWAPGNHLIDINLQRRFESFFRTKLDDIKIESFEVVWKNGVKGVIDVSVAFHIDGIVETAVTVESNYDKIKQAIALCGTHTVLRNRIIENVQHHLLAAIAEMDPLGYGYASAMTNQMGLLNPEEQQQQYENQRKKTLLDLENLFSSQVQATLSSYGVKVDNVTITKNDPDAKFVEQSELLLQQLMEAHKDKQVAELTKEREAIQQQQQLQAMQAETARRAEVAKQAEIVRNIAAADIASQARAKAEAEAEEARVKKASELEKQVMEITSRVEQEKLKIAEQESRQKMVEVEMVTRRIIAKEEAATAAVEKTSGLLAEAEARLKIADLTLKATEFEVKTQALQAEGVQKVGTAEMRVKEMERYGTLDPKQIERIMLAELQLKSCKGLTEALLTTGIPAPGITQLALAPDVLRQLGVSDGIRGLFAGSGASAVKAATGQEQSEDDDDKEPGPTGKKFIARTMLVHDHT